MKSFSVAGFRADPLIARGFPFLLFIALLMLGSAVWPSGAGSDSTAANWFVVARGAIVALVLVWFWPSYSELRDPAPLPRGRWAEAVVVGFVVFLLWIYFDQDWAVLSRSEGFNPQRPDGGTDWPMAILRLAGLAILVPVMEELFWRSLVLRWIEQHDFLTLPPRRIGIRAFVITTALFAIEHEQWLAGAIAGAAYNWLYMRSGNLSVPIVAHVVTNLALGIWVLGTRNWHFW